MQQPSEGTVGHPSDLVQGTWKVFSYPIVNIPTMPERKLLGHKSFYLRPWLNRNNPDFTKTTSLYFWRKPHTSTTVPMGSSMGVSL